MPRTRRVTKTPSYRNAIDFIAQNDEPSILDVDSMIGYATVFLVSELFGCSQETVAADVIRLRKKIAKGPP